MTRIVVGASGRASVSIDLDVLLRTRFLAQSNSGGGKSWLLRRLAERLFGKAPVWIVDPEGEFATLRERFGFVLVGKGGETPADPRSVELVVHKLRELNASVIFDIYDLKPQARHHYVRVLFEALVESPKSLWRPMVLMLDESHVFAPEKGHGESEAYPAVQDVATRGRKRGICLALFTQRLSKLSKNVSAEMLNRMIGPTFEDLDVERAADLLSVPRSERLDFMRSMKVLEPGQFWALGRAIALDRTLVKVGAVETTHPEMGKYNAEPPPPPEKIRALLPKLADLPKQAEEKAKTEQELRSEIRSLKAQLASRPKEAAPKIVEKQVFPAAAKREIQSIGAEIEKALSSADRMLCNLVKVPEKHDRLAYAEQHLNRSGFAARPVLVASPGPPKPGRLFVENKALYKTTSDGSKVVLRAGERRMLETLIKSHPVKLTLAQLAQLSKFAMSGGTFKAYWNTLKRHKLVCENGRIIEATDAGAALCGGFRYDGGGSLLDSFRGSLRAGERKLLDYFAERSGSWVPMEQAGSETGFEHTGGTFKAYVGTLARNNLLIVEKSDGASRGRFNESFAAEVTGS